MNKTFFFYDLETSGFSPRQDRIMQFAGQRTDMDLNKIGEPVNILVKLNDDVLPSPGALLVTKISPQSTVEEGYTEAEFAKMAIEDFFTQGTIAVGYNSVRFDDEHMRYLFWRNFYDPYEWQWKDGRSRWDLLDVVRMVRALRPEGINWPFVETEDGKKVAANKLELLTKLNGIEHENAHDAMSDVDGLIDVAKLLKNKQPQMFDYLLTMRDKNKIKTLINLSDPKPFVYTSGRLEAEFEKTTISYPIAPDKNRNVIVWDLRYDPEQFSQMTSEDISKRLFAPWEERKRDDFVPIPVKVLQYNRCPAVAPVGVLSEGGWQVVGLNKSDIKANLNKLNNNPGLIENIRSAFEDRPAFSGGSINEADPEAMLYDGFLPEGDKKRVEAVRNATIKQLADFNPDFNDERLPELLLHYKARSFPKTLSSDEKEKWETYRVEKLNSWLPHFMKELKAVSDNKDLSSEDEFIIEEMKLWLENILPEGDS